MRNLVLVLLGAASTAPALAQTAALDGDDRDVVIVTGVGSSRTSGELIASTTALSSDDIIERLDGGLGDTLSSLPGVSSTAFGPGASRPIIRGLGAERVQVLTNGIGVIDASAASPDHAVTGDPLGAQRIEILRGPASLAYGGGASGGVVNVIDGLIAERPAERSSAEGYAGYTSVDEGTTLAGRSVIAAGPMTAVLSASSKDAGDTDIPGFAESARFRALEEAEDEGLEEEHEEAFGVLENSFVESDAYSGGVSFAGDAGFVGVSARRLESSYGIVGHHHEEGEEEDGGEEESPFIELEQTRYDIAGGVNFGEGFFDQFRAAVSGVDYQHIEFEAPGVPGTVFTNDGVEGRAELLHEHANGVKGSWGVQGSRRDFAAVGDEAFIAPTQTEQAGVFVFESFEVGELGLEGGLRFDRVELDNLDVGARDFETLNASAGVHGHVTPSLFLGASVSRTERAPTDVELFADGPHLATSQYEVGSADLDTETGVNLELTARWEAGPFEAGLNIYRFAFEDFIYLDATGAEVDGLPVFQAVQADADFTGGELTASYDVGVVGGIGWTLDGSLDVVRAELDAGGNVPRIPPMSAAFGVEGEVGRVTGRVDVRWADTQDDIAAFESPTDSYTTLDASLVVAVTDAVDLILSGSNLTDEEVRLHSSPLKELAPMAGRNLRAAVKVRF